MAFKYVYPPHPLLQVKVARYQLLICWRNNPVKLLWSCHSVYRLAEPEWCPETTVILWINSELFYLHVLERWPPSSPSVDTQTPCHLLHPHTLNKCCNRGTCYTPIRRMNLHVILCAWRPDHLRPTPQGLPYLTMLRKYCYLASMIKLSVNKRRWSETSIRLWLKCTTFWIVHVTHWNISKR